MCVCSYNIYYNGAKAFICVYVAIIDIIMELRHLCVCM